PLGILPAVMSPVAASMYARVGPRLLIFAGMVLVAGSFFWMSSLDRDEQLWLVAVIVSVCSLGLAMACAPLRLAAFEALPDTLQSSGWRWLGTLLPLGGAAGIATMSGWYWQVLTGITDLTLPEVATFAVNVTFFDAGQLGLLPLVLWLFITRVPRNGSDGTQALGYTTAQTGYKFHRRSQRLRQWFPTVRQKIWSTVFRHAWRLFHCRRSGAAIVGVMVATRSAHHRVHRRCSRLGHSSPGMLR